MIFTILLDAGSKLQQKLPEGWLELNSEYQSHWLCYQLFWGISKLMLLNSPSLKSLNIRIDTVWTWKQKLKHLETRSVRTSFYKYFSRKRSLCFHRASQALKRLRTAHIKRSGKFRPSYILKFISQIDLSEVFSLRHTDLWNRFPYVIKFSNTTLSKPVY